MKIRDKHAFCGSETMVVTRYCASFPNGGVQFSATHIINGFDTHYCIKYKSITSIPSSIMELKINDTYTCYVYANAGTIYVTYQGDSVTFDQGNTGYIVAYITGSKLYVTHNGDQKYISKATTSITNLQVTLGGNYYACSGVGIYDFVISNGNYYGNIYNYRYCIPCDEGTGARVYTDDKSQYHSANQIVWLQVSGEQKNADRWR